MPEAIAQSDRDRLAELEYQNVIESKTKTKIHRAQAVFGGGIPSLFAGQLLGLVLYLMVQLRTTTSLKLHTTTNLTADEIHDIRASEKLSRILVEMEEAKNQIGFKGDIKAFLEFIRNSPEQMPFQDPQEVIA